MSQPRRLLHITRKDGEVVAVSTETVIPGPVRLLIGGQAFTASEVRVDVPLGEEHIDPRPACACGHSATHHEFFAPAVCAPGCRCAGYQPAPQE